jgi:hypothetical protein
MAYGLYIAAVDPRELEDLRAGVTSALRTRAVIGMTHLVVYWTKEQLLGETLRRIVDEGSPLGEEFWHPFRPPIVHAQDQVATLDLSLRSAWQALPGETQAAHMFKNEIGEILRLLSAAARDGSALVSVLEPPADEERASRVRCPFQDSEILPFPWGALLAMEAAPRSPTKSGLT